MHAIIALGDDAGDRGFYKGIRENKVENSSAKEYTDPGDRNTVMNTTDSGCENQEIMLQLMEEHDAMTDEITELCDQFVSDVKQRIKQLDTQYLSGIRKFFVTYLNTIQTTEPATSATPQLGSLLHTHINRKTPKVAGTRNIRVQPTALTRRVSMHSKRDKTSSMWTAYKERFYRQ